LFFASIMLRFHGLLPVRRRDFDRAAGENVANGKMHNGASGMPSVRQTEQVRRFIGFFPTDARAGVPTASIMEESVRIDLA
jgi:hypothetical protein